MSLPDAPALLRLTEVLVAAAVAQGALQWLIEPELLLHGGLASGRVPEAAHGPRRRALSAWLVARLPDGWVRLLPASQIALSLLLLVPGLVPGTRGALELGLIATAMLFALRSPVPVTAADSMNRANLVALASANLIPTPFVMAAGLWFIALHACVAYATPGLLKLRERGWRDGTVLARVLGSRGFGIAAFGRWLGARPRLALVAAWSLMLWEALFPTVLVLPRPLTWAILGSGVLFHIANAAVIGVNTFTLSFVATYPAILYCAARLSG